MGNEGLEDMYLVVCEHHRKVSRRTGPKIADNTGARRLVVLVVFHRSMRGRDRSVFVLEGPLRVEE